MKSAPKHAKDKERGKIKLKDFRPSNLHPKAKFRVLMAITGTMLLIFGCIFVLSTTPIYFNVDLTTEVGFSNLMKNLVAVGYVVGTVFIILLLWYLMIKDCPISPAAKANYELSHDKSMKGVKVVTSIASAIANKGTGQSIDNVAVAIDNYFTEDEEEESKNDKMTKPR